MALSRAQEAGTIETAWLNKQEINNLLQIQAIFADYTAQCKSSTVFYRMNIGIANLNTSQGHGCMSALFKCLYSVLVQALRRAYHPLERALPNDRQ